MAYDSFNTLLMGIFSRKTGPSPRPAPLTCCPWTPTKLYPKNSGNLFWRPKKNWTAQGYTFNRLNNYCGQWIHHSGWYPDRKLRLWDSRLGQWAGANPHDRYEMQPGAKTQHLKGDLLHYTANSIKEHFDMLYKYADIGAKELVRQGKGSSWLKLWVNPWFKFFKMYILKRGYKDGLYGLIICSSTAWFTFWKYVLVRYYQREGKEG